MDVYRRKRVFMSNIRCKTFLRYIGTLRHTSSPQKLKEANPQIYAWTMRFIWEDWKWMSVEEEYCWPQTSDVKPF